MCHLCEMQSKLKRAADITESIAEMGSALYDDAITDAFNAIERANNLLDHECEKDCHEAQIIRLNDWMAENEPDVYWGGNGDDTASAILRVIKKYKTAYEEKASWMKVVEVKP